MWVFIFQRLVCISLRPGFSQTRPSLAIYEFDPSWRLCQKQIHHIEGLNYGHDFVLLPDYYVFHMTPFVKGSWWINTKILLGLSSPGDDMRYYPELPSRFVIIPRHVSGDSTGVMFVDTEPCHVSLSSLHFSVNPSQGCGGWWYTDRTGAIFLDSEQMPCKFISLYYMAAIVRALWLVNLRSVIPR